jgi:uncharacterized protein (TIGR03437 family)
VAFFATCVFGQNYYVTTVAGGVPATSVSAGPISSVAVDSAGNPYIAGSYRIREVSGGVLSAIAGRGSGANGYGDGVPASAASFDSANSVAVDSAGNIYVSDGVANRVRKINTGIITTVAGNGTRGFSGDGGLATNGGMLPAGIALDFSDDLFVSPQIGVCATYIVEKQLVIGSAGGPVNLAILDAGNCPWAVQDLPSWITASVQSGAGPATITVIVAPDYGAPRSASFVMANSAFTVTQEPQLVVTTPSPLPVGTTGAAYSQSVTPAGGVPPYTWSIANGTLPAGLTLSSAGVISGTPSAPGISQFTALVTDGASAIASVTYRLTVIAPGGITPPGSIVTSTVPAASIRVFLDSSGNTYSAGVYAATGNSVPPPVSPGAAQGQSNGGMNCGEIPQRLACPNAYFSKYDPKGNLLVGFFLGGAYTSEGTAITADSAGNIYVVGQGDFVPVTAHAAIGSEPLPGNAFAAKISPDGTRFLYVTYLPGQIQVYGAALAADAAGNLYVGGATTSNQAVVTCVSADGSAILYSKVLASIGAVDAVTVDPSGNLVAAGMVGSSDLPVTPGAFQTTLPTATQVDYNAFTAKLDSSGSVLAATYLGGNSWESVSSVASDAAGHIYVAGLTSSENFPTTANALWPALPVPLWSAGSRSGFITKLSGDTTSLLYSTFVMSLEGVFATAIGSDGEMYLTGAAYSGLPLTPSAPQPCFNGGPSAFLAHLGAAGTLLDATYLPDTPVAAMSLASDGSVYVYSSPFLAQVRFGGAGFVVQACATNLLFNAASQIAGTAGVAPGEFVTLFGWGIGPPTGVAYAGQIPTSLGGVQVFFDGVAAPILYAQSQQVNAQAPFAISGITNITLQYDDTTFGPFSMPVTFADPEIFRAQLGVSTQALAFNLDNTLNGPSNPVAAGSYAYFYGTGFGPTSPNCTAGGLNAPVAASLAGVAVTVYDATVLYAGSAPTLPCGVTQINMQVPADTPPGPNFIHLTASSGNNTATQTMNSTIVVK